MLKEEFCRVLCQTNIGSRDVSDFKNAIKKGYHHNWIIDNLPAASIMDQDKTVTTKYVGFPVGFIEDNVYYLYNHVNIIIQYHTVEEDGHRIVGMCVSSSIDILLIRYIYNYHLLSPDSFYIF